MSREIDRAIAEHVMEWKPYTEALVVKDTWYDPSLRRNSDNQPILYRLPHYSTDIRAAWEVVEKMLKDKPVCRDDYISPFYWHVEEHYEGGWEAGFGNEIPYEGFSFNSALSAKHRDVAMAICLAALKAKGISVGSDHG